MLSAAEWFGKLMRGVCSPFLTETEIEAVLNGRDLWLDSDEVILRFEAIQKAREEEAQKAAQEAGATEAPEAAAEAGKKQEQTSTGVEATAPKAPAKKSKAAPKNRTAANAAAVPAKKAVRQPATRKNAPGRKVVTRPVAAPQLEPAALAEDEAV